MLPDPPAARAVGVVTILTAAALLLRAVGLDHLPLWMDEAVSLLATEPAAQWWIDVHPPLYYALLSAWAKVSTHDTWLRLLSALLGAAAVPAVYALGARLLGRGGGVWAAAFLAATWAHVWYSREARMYALLVLAVAVAAWGVVAGARDGQVRGWATYAVAGAAVAWSHAVGVYYAALVAGIALLVVWSAGRSARPWAIATAVLALLYAPWAPTALTRTREAIAGFWLRPVAPEPPFLTTLHAFTVAPIPSPATLLRGRLGLDPGAALGGWVWMALVLAVLALALAGLARSGAVRLLAVAYLAPIGLFTAISLVVRPILLPRILLPVVLPLTLLLAAGVLAVPRRLPRAAVGGAVALVLLAGSAYGLRRDAGYWEDWRGASRHLQEHVRPADTLFIASGRVGGHASVGREGEAVARLLLRYDDTGRLAALARVTAVRAALACPGDISGCLDAATAASRAAGDLWVVHRSSGIPDAVKAWVDRRLEPGVVEEFESVYVERRRPRKVALQPAAGPPS